MIEKLDIELTQSVATNNCIINKINELVGTINEQQLRLDNFKCWLMALENAKNATISKMENVDPYAEQRKWIGKLCRVEAGGEYRYGILKDVSPSHPTHPFNMGGLFFRVCEPVLPTDKVIYKGGKDE